MTPEEPEKKESQVPPAEEAPLPGSRFGWDMDDFAGGIIVTPPGETPPDGPRGPHTPQFPPDWPDRLEE